MRYTVEPIADAFFPWCVWDHQISGPIVLGDLRISFRLNTANMLCEELNRRNNEQDEATV